MVEILISDLAIIVLINMGKESIGYVQESAKCKTKVIRKNNVSLCITFRNFPKVLFLLNSHAIILLEVFMLLTRIKTQNVQVSDYFFVVSKSGYATS